MKFLVAVLLATSLAGGTLAFNFKQTVDAQAAQIAVRTNDPNPKNAALADALCTVNVDEGWDALGTTLREQFNFYGEYAGVTGKDMLAGEFTLPDGTTCDSFKYVAAYTGRDGEGSIYLFAYTDAEGSWQVFYVFISDETGVVDVQ